MIELDVRFLWIELGKGAVDPLRQDVPIHKVGKGGGPEEIGTVRSSAHVAEDVALEAATKKIEIVPGHITLITYGANTPKAR